MPIAPDAIKRLVERYERQPDQVRSPVYNEARLRIDFINPMFRELGWDVDNTQGFAGQYREVIYENRLKVAGQTKAPEYSFRIGGPRKFFLEARKPSVSIKNNWEPAYQLRRYGWSAKLAVSILTNFEEFAVYDCRIQPRQMEKASTARREYITYSQYLDRWDFISGTFSKQAVLRGDFDRYCCTTRGKGVQEFDEAFLVEIEEWRKKLASNLALRNEILDERSLNFAVQRIIDRIIFLRICEDRGIERVGRLQALLKGEQAYPRLVRLFNDADARYNSGLFHFKPKKGRDEVPDELTPTLKVDDATLKAILKRLYYPESPYEFSVISADILGTVYERFLGKVITLTAGHRAKVEEKPEVRKAGGVYYTPTYIVDYIVQQTVGKLLETARTPVQAAKLTILDPACGSGAFLLGAYQYLLDWHLKWYIAHAPENWSKGKKATLRPGIDGHWHLTINERKRILLDNIHGVDIDFQAVEVTKLSLFLKVLEGETMESLGGLWALSHERALPDLGNNIQCGNSLIGTDIMSTDAWNGLTDAERGRMSPFDYDRAFRSVFRRGGFDVVIGNPPWGASLSQAEKVYLSALFPNVADFESSQYFLHKLPLIMRPGGTAGEIIPNTFVLNVYANAARQYMCERGAFLSLTDLSELDVFLGPQVRATTLVWESGGHSAVDCFVWRTPPEAPRHIRSVAGTALSLLDTWKLLFELESPARALVVKLAETCPKLDDYAVVRQGYIPYRTTTLTRRHGARRAMEIVKERQFHSTENNDISCQRELQGADVNRYSITWSGVWVRYGQWVSTYLPLGIFSGPRVLVREITGKPPHRLYAAFTHCVFIHNPSVLAVLPKPNSVDPLFIVAVINSKLTSLAFSILSPKAKKGLFPKIIITDAARIPFPTINLDDKASKAGHDKAVQLAKTMIALQVQLSAAKLPEKHEQLFRQIEATDRQIDQLVYQLYCLTTEEIRTVEEATAIQDKPA